MREIVGKHLPSIVVTVVFLIALSSTNVGYLFGALYSLVGSIMILVSQDDRAIWDLIGRTEVAYFPGGYISADGGQVTQTGQAAS
jgi:hypothetical protein